MVRNNARQAAKLFDSAEKIPNGSPRKILLDSPQRSIDEENTIINYQR